MGDISPKNTGLQFMMVQDCLIQDFVMLVSTRVASFIWKRILFRENTFLWKTKGTIQDKLESLWKFSTNFQFAHKRHPPFQHFWSSRECFARKHGLLPLRSRVPPTPGFSDVDVGVQIQNNVIQRWYMVKHQESAIPITDACCFSCFRSLVNRSAFFQ